MMDAARNLPATPDDLLPGRGHNPLPLSQLACPACRILFEIGSTVCRRCHQDWANYEWPLGPIDCPYCGQPIPSGANACPCTISHSDLRTYPTAFAQQHHGHMPPSPRLSSPGEATSLDPPETESPPRTETSPGAPASDTALQDQHFRALSTECPPSDLLFAEVDETTRQRAEDTAADHICCPPNLSTDFRHSGWVRNRSLVARSMQRTDQPRSRQNEFAQCGSHAYVIQSIENPTVHRIAGSSCHDRFCLPCANERAHGIAMNVLAYVQDKTIRFLTLTLKASQEPLADQLDRLYKSFSELRRRAFWKKRVKGGIAFLELTYNADATMWHPHFHILVEGSYIPHRELKKLWYAITGDSFVVDIRAIRSNNHAAHYVTKYASKPFNNTFLGRPGPLDEALIALKGRKLLMTFGTFRGLQVIDKPDEASWIHIAPLEVVICDAAHGDQAAIAILASITDADLTPIFSRAPPIPVLLAENANEHKQLTFCDAWQADGGHGMFS